jgi:hypothetical protein
MQTTHNLAPTGRKQNTLSRLISIGLLALLPVTARAQTVRLPSGAQPIQSPILVQPVLEPLVVENPTRQPRQTKVQKVSDALRRTIKPVIRVGFVITTIDIKACK